MQATLFLIVTLMPAPLPAIKGQAQCIWRAHHVAVVPPAKQDKLDAVLLFPAMYSQTMEHSSLFLL